MRSPYVNKAFLLLMVTLLLLPGSVSGMKSSGDDGKSAVVLDDLNGFEFRDELYYFQVLEKWEQEGARKAELDFTVPAAEYVQISDDAEVSIDSFQGEDDALIWTNQKGFVDYQIQVPQAGLYEMELLYYPIADDEHASRGPVTFSMQVNNETPFREARSLEFEREFADEWPLNQDRSGNDLRPQVREIGGWKTKSLRDSEGAYPLPLSWNLMQGSNTIRLIHLREPVAIKSIRLHSPEQLPEYEDVSASYSSLLSPSGDIQIIEAEQMDIKNSTSIQVRYDRDAMTTPTSYEERKYNSVGGWRWFKGGEAATWKFTVPETGLYKIGMRVKQNFRRNLSSFRTIYIDGKIPFKEVSVYQFPYKSKWTGVVLGDQEQYYEFLLEKGEHSLTLSASNAPLRKVYSQVDVVSSILREATIELKAATGGQGDEYRVWNVKEDIPGLVESLEQTRNLLETMVTQMIEINGERENISQTFDSAVKDLESLINNPNSIPNRQDQIAVIRESIEALRSFLIDSPLQIDKFYIIPAEEQIPDMTASWFDRIIASTLTFFNSFTKRDDLEQDSEDVLNVWMMWGRDHVNELQQLADEKFTTQYGVKVKINLVQQPELLILSNSAGIMPDVALGVPGDMPYDLALRGAAMNLSQFSDSNEIFSRYSPGFLLPFYHEGSYYAVPETVQYKVLFYRKDILQQLGLQIPDTWEDVYEMLPTLLQNNYNFFIEPQDFSSIFYQNGVQLYEKDGLRSGLDTPQAFAAFEKWTDLYNVYGLEKNVQSFYNQFRKGYLPVGIADFNQFLQLTVAAPELRGLWGIAPVPGTKIEDGTVARWSGGIPDSVAGRVHSKLAGSSMTSAMMFSKSDPLKEQMAWEFIKWYTSTEIQTEFGLNLERFNGEQFRWNTANIAAFTRMPWKPEDLQVLLEQWRWYKDFTIVPGGYMTARELNFAWIRTVIDGENPRSSMEQAVREINRELLRKQQEFHLIDDQGHVLHTLNLPEYNEPWTGVDKYAK